MPQLIDIPIPDGSHSKISLFQNDEKDPLLILFPAMGVPASYYAPFAEHLAEQGLATITADLRGLGLSSLRPSRNTNFGYEDMVQLDYLAIFQTIQKQFPNRSKYVMGHSLGGQLAALFLSRHELGVRGFILIAACSVHPSGWSGWQALRLHLVLRAFAAMVKVFGFFPGDKIGFGGKAPKQQLLDWCHQGRTGKYEPAQTDFDYEQALSRLKIDTLAVSVEGDHLAPPAAMKNLYGKFSIAQVKQIVYSREAAGHRSLNHFNWARQPQGISQLLLQWINDLDAV